MSSLEDTAIFFAIVQQGGFSHAAKHLNISNGLVSRRIASLEKRLGVTLINRTTRQIRLTKEGEIFFKHSERIQQELTSALSLIQASAKQPRGLIRITAPLYFGRQYLSPIINKFLSNYQEIKVELILTGEKYDPIKTQCDLVIRGAGFLSEPNLKDSNLKSRLLLKEKIGLYASPSYLYQHGNPGTPNDLQKHAFIHYLNSNDTNGEVTLQYIYEGQLNNVRLKTKFRCNDIETNIMTCISGHGIGRFTDLNVKQALVQNKLCPILQKYDWGDYHLYALYSQQQALPSRTRLLLDFIAASI